MGKTKEISVFVDESGSFDPDRSSSRYYLVCMVFHDQEKDISRQIEVLEQNLVEPRGSDPIGGTPRKLGRTY